MSNKIMNMAVACCLSLSFGTFTSADMKVKSKYTAGNQVTENTVHTKGARQRFEYGQDTVMIHQCDLKRIIQINDKAATYLEIPTTGASIPVIAPETGTVVAEPARKGGIVTLTTTLTDTGEKKTILGHNARHIKTTLVREPSQEACDQKREKIETDGWYIDLKVENVACSLDSTAAAAKPAGCNDEVRHKQAGKGKLGYPVQYTLTNYGQDGNVVSSLSMEVVELSTNPLEAALFEAPAGYAQAQDMQEMARMTRLVSASAQSETSGVQIASGPKKDGIHRVGILNVSNRTNSSFSGVAADDQLFRSFLQEKLEAVPLAGVSPADIENNARLKQCDFVLYNEVTEFKKSAPSKFGGVMNRVSQPGGGSKEKLEAKVDFRLVPVGQSSPRLASSVTGINGGGFNWKGAMQLGTTAANFASMGMMSRYMMADPRMMNLFLNMQGGSMTGSPLGSMDPTMGGLMLIMQIANPGALSSPANLANGAGAPTATSENAGREAALAAALDREAKAIAAELSKKN